MADDTANQAEQQEKAQVMYVDENGDTKSRKALDEGEQDAAEAPAPLGTDPAALEGNDKPEFMTAKDAEKAEKDGTTL